MSDLTDFLLARIAEDEAAAQAAFSGQADPEHGWGIEGRAITPHVGIIHEDIQRLHVAKWNPARVLAECEAKRRIVEVHRASGEPPYCAECTRAAGYEGTAVDYPCATLRLLALPYADHEDYREEWAAD